MKKTSVLLCLVACASPVGIDTQAILGDSSVDAAWSPTPNAVFTDPSGFHPSVTLQAPDDYASSPEVARPLVILLHGFNEDQTVQSYFQFSDLRNVSPNGALVLVPLGAQAAVAGVGHPHYWNASAACCDEAHVGNNDVAYVGGLIDRVIAAGWHVDLRYVIVIGRSNGDFMAHRLACDRGDVVTAIVAQSGANGSVGGDPACLTTNHVHELFDKSEHDATILYAGGTQPGEFFPYPPATAGSDNTVSRGATRNGCTGALALVQSKAYNHDLAIDGNETDLYEFSGCPSDGKLTFWHQLKSGHKPRLSTTWPTDVWAWVTAHPR